MLLQVVTLCCLYALSVDATVLDPSLYLSPTPPLTRTTKDISPEALWSGRSADSKMTADTNLSPDVVDKSSKIKRKPDSIKAAKLFWPSLRAAHYSVGAGNIQIPLTFSLSGLYGKYSPGAVRTGIIGSSYGTVSEIGGTAISALAGSSYGNYRTYPKLRIYGGENGPAWSGWGNGKWGNYGKG